jgi:hypothetical protein
MNKGRRIGALAAAAVAAIGMTMTVATAPASAAKAAKGPQPVSQLLQRVDENSTETVYVWFKTDRRICNFKLRVWDNSRVDVTHPQGWYTSLSRDDRLQRNERDYVTFDVKVGDYARDTWQLLYATMSYDNCNRRARTQTKSTGFLLPVNA